MTKPNANIIFQHYNDGMNFKGMARKSKSQKDLYLQAAKEFNAAAQLTEEYINNSSISITLKQECRIYSNYYFYEEYDCKRYYYYEKRDYNRAKEFHEGSLNFINEAIEITKSCLGLFQGKTKEKLQKHLPRWLFYKMNCELQGLAIEARLKWDDNDFVATLDYYRTIRIRAEETLAFIKENSLPADLQRITQGNYLGTLVNESSAYANIIVFDIAKVTEIEGKYVSFQLAKQLIESSLEGYKWAIEAFRTNPESEQYLIGAENILNNISRLLLHNINFWDDIYNEFKNEEEIVKLMRRINLKRAKAIEKEQILDENPLLKLWVVGAFFLFIIGAILGLILVVFKIGLNWWQLVLCIGTWFTFSTVVSVLILRTIGEISEKGMIEIIKLAFHYQFKTFSLINSVFKKQNNANGNIINH